MDVNVASTGEGGSSGSHDDTATAVVDTGTAAAADLPEARQSVAHCVGRYVVLDELGRGAMGRVLRAYDPKLQREVALKELRSDVLGAEESVLLVDEARAMAKLSHPNVVAIYDVEERWPESLVLAMEYVPGGTLRAWLRERRPWPDVLQRFIPAGRGLAAAHAVGLLHRDFKPANVLLGDGGVVKVTDFGLAKSLGDVQPRSSVTSGGTSAECTTRTRDPIGTPRYMAPEQHRGEALTAAADQYGFCVALWEALVGKPPFRGGQLAEAKAKGPPPWPENAPAVPRVIVDAIRRGLAADPRDRWPDLYALLDVLRYDPARRRRRAGFVAVASIAVLGIATMSWLSGGSEPCSGAAEQMIGIWDSETRSRVESAMLGLGLSYAGATWERTSAALDGYATEWTTMHTEACAATTVRGEQSTDVMDLRMACLHRARQDLAAVTGVLTQADAAVVMRSHQLVGALRPLERCADIDALAADVEPPLPGDVDRVERIRAELAHAKALGEAGRYEQSRQRVVEAKALLEGVDYGPVRTEVAYADGTALERLGDYEGAEASLRVALQSATAWRQWDALHDVASSLMYVLGDRQKRLEAGLQFRELAIGAARGDPRREAQAENKVANVLHAQGKFPEAEAGHRRALALRETALGPEHVEVAQSRNNLAGALFAQGKYEASQVEFRAALGILERSLSAEHPQAAAARSNLAMVLDAVGNYEEAEREYRRALAQLSKALGPEHPHVATTRNNLAMALHKLGRNEEAEAEYGRALEQRIAVLGEAHADVAETRNNIATLLRGQGRYQAAEVEVRRALAAMEKAMGAEHPDTIAVRKNLADILHAQDELAGAEAEYRAVLRTQKKVLGDEHPEVAVTASALAAVLLQRGRADEALPLAEQAWERQQREDIPRELRAKTAFVVARALWGTAEPGADGIRTRARTLAQRAREELVDARGSEASATAAQVDAWLAAHAGP